MSFSVWVITGLPVYDYFFSLVMMTGLIAIVPAQIFKLFR